MLSIEGLKLIAFEALKKALITPPVLALPNFKGDASGDMIGAICVNIG